MNLRRIVRGVELLELVLGLAAEVGAVDQKQDALGVGELDQPVGDVAAVNVLPEPVAIWISARGRFSRRDSSVFWIASIWASHSGPTFSAGIALMPALTVGEAGFPSDPRQPIGQGLRGGGCIPRTYAGYAAPGPRSR